jgi:hypothetical protein
MSNIDKLKHGGVLKPYAELDPDEEAIVESLDEHEVDQVIGTQDTPKNKIDNLVPQAGIGTHHIVGFPDEEP